MRSTSFLPYLVGLFTLAAVVVACSDDESDVTFGAASSSGGSGRTSSSSGRPPNPSSGTVPGTSSGWDGPYSSSSSSGFPGTIDIGSLVTLTISNDWCEKPKGQCLDAQSFTVDFLNGTITNTTCVEVGGAPDSGASGGTQDANTSHDVSTDDLEIIKQRLAALKTAGYGGIADGGLYGSPARTLEVTTKAQGTQYYMTTDTICPPQPGAVSLSYGWQELWDTIRGM